MPSEPMTRKELLRAVDAEIADTLLHASYSIAPTKYKAVQFAMSALRAGLAQLAEDQGLARDPHTGGTAND